MEHDFWPDLPEICASRLNPTGEPILIKRGESGYHPADHINPDEFNTTIGVTPRQVAAMELGSMFGWHISAANPANNMHDKLKDFPYQKLTRNYKNTT